MRLDDVEALILAGGRGSRLGPTTSSRPKPLLSVGGRPFLEWLILDWRRQGVRRFVLCTGHLAGQIEEYFGNGARWGVTLQYSFCRVVLGRLLREHRESAAAATLWVVREDDCARYGAIDRAEDGSIRAFAEKKASAGSGYINAGVYALQRQCLEAMPSAEPFSIERDLFPRLIGRLHSVTGDGPFIDIGTPESLARAEDVMRALSDG